MRKVSIERIAEDVERVTNLASSSMLAYTHAGPIARPAPLLTSIRGETCWARKEKNMPTILYIRGWRLFFYANERGEPPHIHARKGDIECKYWLRPDTFDVEENYMYNLSPADRRAIRKIIFEHFDYIMSEYEAFHRGVN